MNSLPWIGKLTGCLGSDAFIERVGYKKTMYAAAIIQIVALISKLYALSARTKSIA
jgi:SP family sugar:H+ symporter-like MFS transporter